MKSTRGVIVVYHRQFMYFASEPPSPKIDHTSNNFGLSTDLCDSGKLDFK